MNRGSEGDTSFNEKLYTKAKLPQRAGIVKDTLMRHIDESRDFMTQKRDKFEQIWHLYRKYNNDPYDDTLKGTDLFVVLDMYRAVDSSDRVIVDFHASDNKPSSVDKAGYLNKNFEYDWEFGKYAVADDEAKRQRDLNGCGVIYFNYWNKNTLMPEVTSVPTIKTLFDPEGGDDVQQHRWIGFAMRYTVADMLNDREFIQPAVQDYAKRPVVTKDSETEQDDRVEAEFADDDSRHDLQQGSSREMDPGQGEGRNAAKDIVDVYDIFTTFYDEKSGKARKYLLTVTQTGSHIFRCKEVRPTTAEEQKTPEKTRYPVVLKHFYPVFRSDPIGLSPADLISDKQVFKSTTLNSAKKLLYKNLSNPRAVVAGSLTAGQVHYDPDEIIEVALGEGQRSINDVISSMPAHNLNLSDVLNLLATVDKDIEEATGVNDVALGNSPEHSTSGTLGEIKVREQNINVRNRRRLMQTVMDMKRFTQIWYDEYRRNYRGAAAIRNKTIAIQVGETRSTYRVSAADFSETIPDIQPKSRILEKEEARAKAEHLYSILPHIQASGDRTTYNNALRKIVEYAGVYDENEVDLFTQTSTLDHAIEIENTILLSNRYIPLLPNQITPEGITQRLKKQNNIPSDAGRRRYGDLIAAANDLQLQEQDAMQQMMAGGEVAEGNSGQMSPESQPSPARIETLR